MGERAGFVRLGGGGVDVGSPVEVFHQLQAQVFGPLNSFEDLTIKGVVGALWFPLSGDCQNGALVDIE